MTLLLFHLPTTYKDQTATMSSQRSNETKTKEDPLSFDSNQQANDIPQEFVWPDHEKPCKDVKVLEVPLIDLGGFLSGDSVSEAIRLVSEASKQHGFFLVTNHGVDESLLSRVHMAMDNFFKAPADVKRKAQRTWGESTGYASSFVGRFSTNLPWKETLSFKFTPEEKCHSQTIRDFVSMKMGDQYEDFGKVYQEYAEVMNTLSLKIMELLGMSLGLHRSHLREFYEDNESIFRLNYYPKCKQPEVALGTGPHCDPTSLTILLQDQVDGLQVFVDNEWQAIPPNPQAFVVNIGDTLMALTNRLYKSCLHRAVVNSERERKTLAFFLCPKGDKVVKAPEELVRGGEREYPNFTWSWFLEFTQNHYRSDMNALDEVSLYNIVIHKVSCSYVMTREKRCSKLVMKNNTNILLFEVHFDTYQKQNNVTSF